MLYYSTKEGYYFKEYKNGQKKRITKEEYYNNKKIVFSANNFINDNAGFIYNYEIDRLILSSKMPYRQMVYSFSDKLVDNKNIYELVSIQHLGRHGSRHYIEHDTVQNLIDYFKKTQKTNYGKLLFKELQFIHKDATNNYSFLTERGKKEHQIIATNLWNRTKNFFIKKSKNSKKAIISAHSTNLWRSIESGLQFLSIINKLLKIENGNKKYIKSLELTNQIEKKKVLTIIKKKYKSDFPIQYCEYKSNDFSKGKCDTLSYFDYCTKYKDNTKRSRLVKKYFGKSNTFNKIANRIHNKIFGTNCSLKNYKEIFTLFRMYIIYISETKYPTNYFKKLFRREELIDMNKLYNTIKKDLSVDPIIKNATCIMMKSIRKDFNDIISKNTKEPIIFRFGHAKNIFPLLNFHNKYFFKNEITVDKVSFASNFVWYLYKDKQNKLYVGITFDSIPVTLKETINDKILLMPFNKWAKIIDNLKCNIKDLRK